MTQANLAALVDELDKLHTKSTQGEWFAWMVDGEQCDVSSMLHDCCIAFTHEPDAAVNREWIIAHHNAWPTLSAELREAIQRIEKTEMEVEKLHRQIRREGLIDSIFGLDKRIENARLEREASGGD